MKNSSEQIKRFLGILGKPFEWIGSAVLLLLHGLKFIWLSFRITFQTKRGRVRWSLFAIILLTLITALYNYPNYYNNFAVNINPKIKSIENYKFPSGFEWASRASQFQFPTLAEVPFRLGLDLIGGTQLLYDADTSKIPESDRASALEGVRDVIERRVNAFGVAEPVVQTDRSGDQWRVLVELAGIDNVNEAIRQIGETPLLEFKERDPEPPAPPELTPEQQQEIDNYNAEALKKAEEVIVRLKNGDDFGELARELSDDTVSAEEGGELGFMAREVLVPEYATAIFDELDINEVTQKPVKTIFGYHIIEKLDERVNADGVAEVNSRHILIRGMSEQDFLSRDANAGWKNTELSGKQLDSATVVFDQQTNQAQVQLTFNDEGSRLFEEITGRNVGQPVGIFLDGQPISLPTVNEAIVGGQAVITGSFTIDEAKILAQRLNAGALPVPITLVSQQTVGAKLGKIAIRQSLEAALVGFLLVALFMILYYRLPGVLSVISLLVYGSLVLAFFKFWPVTLTLAGVTGFVLSIGMAVDANVLIFERLKEELKAGRSLSSSVEVGFKRAWTSIRDSNASSLITCAILYWFGTSVVKGFAFTLGIGIVLSMFTAIVVTRTFLRLVVTENSGRHLWIYGGALKKQKISS